MNLGENYELDREAVEQWARASLPPLTIGEERVLCESYLANPTSEAYDNLKDTLIRSNIKLAIKIAKHSYYRDRLLSEKISDAVMGLIEAFENFKPEAGVRFATYAGYHIVKRLMYKTRLNAWKVESREVSMNAPIGRRGKSSDGTPSTIENHCHSLAKFGFGVKGSHEISFDVTDSSFLKDYIRSSLLKHEFFQRNGHWVSYILSRIFDPKVVKSGFSRERERQVRQFAFDALSGMRKNFGYEKKSKVKTQGFLLSRGLSKSRKVRFRGNEYRRYAYPQVGVFYSEDHRIIGRPDLQIPPRVNAYWSSENDNFDFVVACYGKSICPKVSLKTILSMKRTR